MPEQDTYQVKLEIFEGPLDLLLYLIRRNEIDIYDIPIAVIVEQYLAYLDLMRSLNLEVAGDFLVMAATLSHIKSQMLLPEERGTEEEGEAGPDPRAELVRKLLEYQRFKEVAEELLERPLLGRDVFTRPPAPELIEEAAAVSGIRAVEFAEAGIFELLSALKEVLERSGGSAFHEISLERISLMDRIQEVLTGFRARQTMDFEELFPRGAERSFIIVTFLAILELIRLKVLKAFQSEPFGPISLMRAVDVDEQWVADNLPRLIP